VNDSFDFTLLRYKQYLSAIKQSWDVISFDEINNNNLNGKPKALIRHDIDLSLHQSLKMAKLEHELGIKATYFIHLQNEFYNVLEIESQHMIRNIITLGHDIGVHFDINAYSKKINKSEDIDYWASFEKNIYEQLFNCNVKTLSFHNPTLTNIEFNQKVDTVGGMLNTYSSVIFDHFKYISDSNGHWRFDKMDDFLVNNKQKNIQFLSHPGWWLNKDLKPRKKIEYHINLRHGTILNNYDKILEASNRENIG
jgi:hypothetical protein